MAASKIDEIHIQNFKFFPEMKEPIKLGGNHLLLYGENGSGKSSIYWALYTLLECANKTDVNQVKKYFDPNPNEERLININCPTNIDSFIKVKLDDGTDFIVSYSDTSIMGNQDAQESNYSSDFITYKNLLNLHNFAHSKKIDLIPFFEYAIFPHINVTPLTYKHRTSGNLSEIWLWIKDGLQKNIPKNGKLRYPVKGQKSYDDYNDLVTRFIQRVKDLLTHINTEGNLILNQKFKYNFSFSLSLECQNYGTPPNGEFFTVTKNEFKPPQFQVNLSIPLYESLPDVVKRPHSFLNEAKLTALGLAIRLAVLERSLEPNSKLNILILDDLLISLDMSNRENILDLILKEYTNKYQLLILTHDKNFFEFTRHRIKKLKQTEWEYKEMYVKYVSNIPQPYIKQSDTYIDNAEKYFHLKEYEIAGNFLRKEAEAFCKEFLPKKYHYTSEYNLHELNGLISQSLQFAVKSGLDKTLFEDLDNHRKFVFNPTSHDSYEIPKFYSEIENCIGTLKELRNIQNEKFCDRSEQIEFTLTDIRGNVFLFEINLEDDFRLIKEPTKASVISIGMINYYITKNGIRERIQHKVESIKKMYESLYAKSDQTMPSDFWDAIIISKSGNQLNILRRF